MKKGNPIMILIVGVLIFCSSACDGKSTQTTPVITTTISNTNTSETPTETLESGSTPSPENEGSIEPASISTATENSPTKTSSPGITPNPLENTSDPNISQNPYPQPTGDPLNPYPSPFISTPDIGQNPYPQPLIDTPLAGMGQDPYPPPSPNVTQPIAINPIQTPAATNGINASATISATSTTIVRTNLMASDPATVKLISGKYQMIEFFAFWCPYCKSMAPVMNGLEGKYRGRLTFVYLDIDDKANKPFKEALDYKYQPHFFLLNGEGKILHQWNGFTLVEEFEAVLAPLFP